MPTFLHEEFCILYVLSEGYVENKGFLARNFRLKRDDFPASLSKSLRADRIIGEENALVRFKKFRICAAVDQLAEVTGSVRERGPQIQFS